jgi:iturin family lipopeptide synthetase B
VEELTGNVEASLAHHWKRILGVDSVQTEDNFFDMGGDSYGAVELTDSVLQDTGRELDLERIFSDGTYSDLLDNLRESS